MEVLTERRLNRALLERQLLLRRVDLSPAEALRHLVGLQAQAPQAPYVGLWSRLADFKPEQLSDLIAGHEAVRAVLMRATIHLVTADDVTALWPLVSPTLHRNVFSNVTYGRHRLEKLDIDAVLAEGRRLLEERPRSAAELRPLLAQRWPQRDPAALAYAVRQLLPLVHVPPRGLWRAGGQPRFTTVEQWLGRGVDAEPSVDRMVLRYLAAFGPATVKDVQTWCGLTGLREVVERLPLRALRDDKGRELYDLPDAPLPDPDTPVPPRFLPEYDNLLVSHADRSRVMVDGYLQRIFTRGSVLADGFVRGNWKLTRRRKVATLVVELFEPLSAEDRQAVAAEGARLLGMVAADSERHDVQFTSGHVN